MALYMDSLYVRRTCYDMERFLHWSTYFDLRGRLGDSSACLNPKWVILDKVIPTHSVRLLFSAVICWKSFESMWRTFWDQAFKLSPESLPKLLFNLESVGLYFPILELLLSSDYACVQSLEPVFTVSAHKREFSEM